MSVFRGGVHGRSRTLAPAPRGSRYSDFRLNLALPCEQRGKPGEVWGDDTDDDCRAAHDSSRPYQTICDRARIREKCWIVRNLLRLRVFTGNPSEQSDDLVFDRRPARIRSAHVSAGGSCKKKIWSPSGGGSEPSEALRLELHPALSLGIPGTQTHLVGSCRPRCDRI
jgi:hypothetical protein